MSDVKKILVMARKFGAKEIVFIDPTFNNYRPFDKLLDLLIKMNADSYFSFNAEIKPHLLTDKQIDKINMAGFDTLEAGLQTICPDTQKKISCVIPVDKFSRNISRLSDKITKRLDLISALPGEGIKEIKAGLNYLKNNHPESDIYLYQLSAIPGTKIRKLFKKESYLARPPYYVIDNGKMKPKTMKRINEIFSDVTGEDLDPLPSIDEVYNDRKKYNYFLFKPKSSDVTIKTINAISLLNIVEFKSKTYVEQFCKTICTVMKKLTEKSPFSSFIIFINMPHPDKAALAKDIVDSSRLVYEQYGNRCQIFNDEIANIRIGYVDDIKGA